VRRNRQSAIRVKPLILLNFCRWCFFRAAAGGGRRKGNFAVGMRIEFFSLQGAG
jgi:hypothetical protein